MDRADYRALRCRDTKFQVKGDCALYLVDGDPKRVRNSLRKNWEAHSLFCEYHNSFFGKEVSDTATIPEP